MLDIRAPKSGILSGLTLSIGATVRPGDPVARVSAGPSDQIEAQVLDAYATDLRVGGQARILDQSQVLLTIVAIDPEVREGTVSVRLAFASPPSSSIRAGQTIQVAFHVGQPRRAVVVPFSDVVGPGTAWIVDDNGKTARRRPIELGARAADKVEVRSGIRPGDRVIASSRQSLEGLDSIEIAP
jgi:HlyD family secretion protein